jgi:hypothetical protein
MKPGAGSQKGSSFERVISRALTKWITGKEKPEIFWRAASSGAKATVEMRSGILSNMSGDITAIGTEGSWFCSDIFVECKSYRHIGIESFLFQKGELFCFWIKTCRQASDQKKIPLMIIKENRKKIFVMINRETDIEELYAQNLLSRVKFSKDTICDVFYFEDFLSIDPESLKFALAKRRSSL